MTLETFETQFARLKKHFGERPYSDEIKTLIAKAILEFSDDGLKTFVDVSIGSRPVNKPPLVPDFREAAQAEANRQFQADVAGAAKWESLDKRTPPERRQHMLKVLSAYYGHVESIAEAMEIARLRLEVSNANRN